MEADDSYCTEGATAWQRQAVAANAMARLCGEGAGKSVRGIGPGCWVSRKTNVVILLLAAAGKMSKYGKWGQSTQLR